MTGNEQNSQERAAPESERPAPRRYYLGLNLAVWVSCGLLVLLISLWRLWRVDSWPPNVAFYQLPLYALKHDTAIGLGFFFFVIAALFSLVTAFDWLYDRRQRGRKPTG